MASLFVAVFPLLLGIAFTGAAAVLLWPLLRVRRTWVRTTGTVVDVEEFQSGGETVRRVELRFRDAAGREWTSRGDVLWGTARYEAGGTVPILFDPANPASVRVDTFPELWLVPTVVGAVGAVGLLLGLFFAAGSASSA